MKIKYLCALLLAALIYSCDDSTTGIGTDLIPGGDKIPANTDSYEFTTKSLLADSVYARTSTAYLGRYTDEQFGEFTADFIAQFTCMDKIHPACSGFQPLAHPLFVCLFQAHTSCVQDIR